MASEASLYSGAGLVEFTRMNQMCASLMRNPEIMTLGISKFFSNFEKFNVILYGPGMQKDNCLI